MPNNKAVLLSIQPVWCSKIVLKEKTVEVRKTKPEGVKPPFKCYIYCTKEQSKMGWLRIPRQRLAAVGWYGHWRVRLRQDLGACTDMPRPG